MVEQFVAAANNAIFIFPEGPKNAPDSYGGKLEKEGVFGNLQTELLQFLFSKKIIKKNAKPMFLILAGHSGAYRVIAKIIEHNATLPIAQTLLFDALYGEIETYKSYIKNKNGLVHIYTDSGGTMQNSLDFMKQLDAVQINYVHKEEDALTMEDLWQNKIVFIHSKNSHNEVIGKNKNLLRFLHQK